MWSFEGESIQSREHNPAILFNFYNYILRYGNLNMDNQKKKTSGKLININLMTATTKISNLIHQCNFFSTHNPITREMILLSLPTLGFRP